MVCITFYSSIHWQILFHTSIGPWQITKGGGFSKLAQRDDKTLQYCLFTALPPHDRFMVGGMFWTSFVEFGSPFYGPGKFPGGLDLVPQRDGKALFLLSFAALPPPIYTGIPVPIFIQYKTSSYGGAFCDGIKGWWGGYHVVHSLPCHSRVNIRIASLVATLVGCIFWTHSLTFFCGVRFSLLQTWEIYLVIATW